MTPRQRLAREFTCRLAQETAHPRFRRQIGRVSTIITLDSGYA